MENKKISNRAIQNIYASYKSKSEVDKALQLLKTVSLAESTYKFLDFFSHKNAKGVTQAKIETICKKAGISTSTYFKTVKPDLDSFPEPLIIQIPTQKKGKDGKKNQGSSYKVLQPLTKIEEWVPQRQEEILQNHKDLIKQLMEEKHGGISRN